MGEKEEKRYCVIDHANKQLDRDRRHKRRRAQRWLRPGAAVKANAADETDESGNDAAVD